MARPIREADWRYIRELGPAFFSRLESAILTDVTSVLASEASTRARIDRIDRRIREGERLARDLHELFKRSGALFLIARLRTERLMTDDEFTRLSPEVRELVGVLTGTDAANAAPYLTSPDASLS